jgi:hypothetical protein
MNFALTNPGPFPNINFGGTGPAINTFYYNVIADSIYAHQIIENSGFAEQVRVTPNGTVYLKGVKVIDAGYTKKFSITNTGNMIAKAFTTEL